MRCRTRASIFFLASVLCLTVAGAAAVGAGASAVVAYHLPFPAGDTCLVTQGNSEPYTHRKGFPAEFAWDFLMPVGSMVSAAAPGTVVAAEQGYRTGAFTEEYIGKANYVTLLHDDGRFSLYSHLAYNGVLVRVGDRVLAGQGIALSGDTGYTSGPHLHFQVQKTAVVSRGESVPVSFADAGVPETGDHPVSANAYLPPASAPRAIPDGLAVAPSPQDLVTHQRFPVAIGWDPGDEPAKVRLVAYDALGERRTLATSDPAMTGGTSMSTSAAADVSGPYAVWAEYQVGSGWRPMADHTGRLAAAVMDAAPRDIFVARPGVTAAAPTAAPGTPVEVGFSLIALGEARRTLLGITVEVVRSDGSVVETDDLKESNIPVIPRVTLAPGSAREWRGTVVLHAAGTYRLRPKALDASGDRLPLPPAQWGDPTWVTLVVGTSPPPPPPSPPPRPPEEATFLDLPAGHPAHAAAEALAAAGLLTGYPDGQGGREFRPDDLVARAQFAKLLLGVLGVPVTEADRCRFADVEDSGPIALYPDNVVAAAETAGLVLGLPGDPPRFAPYSPVTRRQMGVMAGRARPASAWTVPGDPWAYATRAEAAVLLAQLLP